MGCPDSVCIVTGANAGIGAPCASFSHDTHAVTSYIDSTSNHALMQWCHMYAGKEVTAGLMERGHHVIMACRNMSR